MLFVFACVNTRMHIYMYTYIYIYVYIYMFKSNYMDAYTYKRNI